jgi:hypothetical protein
MNLALKNADNIAKNTNKNVNNNDTSNSDALLTDEEANSLQRR